MKNNFSIKQNKNNLCLRWHILRSQRFVAEVTFKPFLFSCDEIFLLTAQLSFLTSMSSHDHVIAFYVKEYLMSEEEKSPSMKYICYLAESTFYNFQKLKFTGILKILLRI